MYWREHRIRERAYAIWEQEGRLNGKDLEYWLRAEADIAAEDRAAAQAAKLEKEGVV